MARTITGAAFLSLDGVMQAPGGPTEDYTGGFEEGGWVFKLWDDGVGEEIGSLFSGDYDLLLGRRTYEIFAAYWPYVEGPEKEMGEAFTKAGKLCGTPASTDLNSSLLPFSCSLIFSQFAFTASSLSATTSP